MFDEGVKLLLIIAIWCALFAAYGAWEKYRKWKKRHRFEWQLHRWR